MKPVEAKETVVLLHGLFGFGSTLYLVEKALHELGFATLNITYLHHQFRHGPEAIGNMIAARLNYRYGPEHTIHFLGHSLGGLIARSILANPTRFKVGNVVMLGTPNQGAIIVNQSPFLRIVGRLLGQLYYDLGRGSHYIRSLPKFEHPLGLIAGTRPGIWPLNPFAKYHPNGGDGIVEVDSVALEGGVMLKIEVDHIHMLLHRDVISEAVHFIKHGRFTHGGTQEEGN